MSPRRDDGSLLIGFTGRDVQTKRHWCSLREVMLSQALPTIWVEASRGHCPVRGQLLNGPCATVIGQARNDATKGERSFRPLCPHRVGGIVTRRCHRQNMYPVYVRGEAYLAAHQGSEAAVEFQKILDHRGIVLNSPIGALAHLQIARAYAMQGDTAKAKAAYQDFLTLWKDADPDIPIFIAAKAEYAKLH